MSKGSFAPIQKKPAHLNFDGVDDKIIIPHATSIDNLPLNDFTVEFVGTFSTPDAGEIFSKANPSGGSLYIYVSHFSGQDYIIATVTYDNYDGSVSPSYPAIDSSNPHHYEFDWNASSKTFELFIDGVLITPTDSGVSGTQNTYDDDSAYPLSLYYGVTEAGYPLGGYLRYLKVSNTIKHTSNFIPPSLKICPAPDNSTVLRLALDEGSGILAKDTSGNGNNGTISGATWELD